MLFVFLAFHQVKVGEMPTTLLGANLLHVGLALMWQGHLSL